MVLLVTLVALDSSPILSFFAPLGVPPNYNVMVSFDYIYSELINQLI